MVPDIPYDVFLQIFESCSDSKDVVSLGGVCAQWREFFDTRDVWAMLVSRFLDRHPSPRLHYVEISSYRDKDSVKNLYRRLKLSEMAWKVAGDYETKVEKLDLDPGCCAKTSILAPGGRFLIVFTNLIQAFCFDLDSRSPRPIAIIPAQIQTMSHYLPEGTDQTSDELAHEIQVEVSAPDMDSTAENLSFRAVVTYGARYRDSTVQVWQFDSVFDDATGQPSLTALRLLSWAPGYGFLRCRSFLGNKLVLEAPDMDVGPGLPSDASKFLIFNWRKASENPSDFPLRTLFTYTSVELVQLLKSGFIVIYSLDEGLVLYKYASIPVYTGPRTWGRIMNLYPKFKKRLSLDYYSLMSRPYYMEDSSEGSDVQDDIPAGSLILCNSEGELHEMDIEADIKIHNTSMAPNWYLGTVSRAHEDPDTERDAAGRSEDPDKLQMCLGYSHAASIVQGHLKLITYWRGAPDKGGLTMKEIGIMASADARLQMDEGSGRIVIFEVIENSIQIIDLVG